jgi:hypothetical protein
VIVVVPGDTPPATPVPEPIMAIAILLLLQVPPDTESVSSVVDPMPTIKVPVITDGAGFTVTRIVTMSVPSPFDISTLKVSLPT